MKTFPHIVVGRSYILIHDSSTSKEYKFEGKVVSITDHGEYTKSYGFMSKDNTFGYMWFTLLKTPFCKTYYFDRYEEIKDGKTL